MSPVHITWWGHATVAVTIGGVTVLTDPVLAARLAHLRRIGSPVPPRKSVTEVDAVVISHLHPDHLHLPSLRAFGAGIDLVVPRGAGEWCATHWHEGLVHEASVGEAVALRSAGGEVLVRAVNAFHDGRRLPASTHRGAALGYVISAGATSVWFAGDTGLFAAMSDVGPVDVAVVPVGGWGPTLGPHHLDPAQAAEAVARVGARHAVPIHYGTFWPVGLRRLAPGVFAERFVAPGRRFADAVGERGLDTQVHVLESGGSVDVDG